MTRNSSTAAALGTAQNPFDIAAFLMWYLGEFVLNRLPGTKTKKHSWYEEDLAGIRFKIEPGNVQKSRRWSRHKWPYCMVLTVSVYHRDFPKSRAAAFTLQGYVTDPKNRSGKFRVTKFRYVKSVRGLIHDYARRREVTKSTKLYYVNFPKNSN
jgi:hypothetical protein